MPGGGKKIGTKAYDVEVLYNCIAQIRPTYSAEWAEVAALYQSKTEEENVRDGGDVKRAFMSNKKMCNGHKKVTGTSDNAEFTKKCIKLAKELGDKESIGLVGGDDDDDDDDNEEDDEGSDEGAAVSKTTPD